MFSPRWAKVLRDLWLNLPRTMLVIFAITLGVIGVGSVLDAFAVINREIDTNWIITNPASATLSMPNVDSDALNVAKNFPGVADVEARGHVYARVQVGPDAWENIVLFVVSDFDNLRIFKFWPESGSWPPADRQILIERAAIPFIHKTTGDMVTVKTLTGMPHELSIVGVTWDPSQAPAWVDGVAYGYITPNTMNWLGMSAPFNELRIIVNQDQQTETQIRAIANQLSAALQQQSHTVSQIDFPVHPHRDQMNSFLFLLESFGLLCLLLSGVLTATLISALLSQQIRQIGVMKAIGATTRQVMGIYFGTVLILSLIALVIAIPLGLIVGRIYTISAMGLLNFNVTNFAVPLWVYAVQMALGILIPLITAAYPVYRGSRITVREAISDYGVSQTNLGTDRFDSLLARVRGLPRPFVLSLRNTFRRRARLFLTLLMLAAGGASFIAALGTAASWNNTLDDTFATSHYDIQVRFAQPYPVDAIQNTIRGISGVTDVETWGMLSAFPKYADGSYGSLIQMFAPPTNTTLISPSVVAGRWLQPGDTNAVVISSIFAEPEQGPQVHVGDNVTLRLNGQDITWHVVGIVRELSRVGTGLYASRDYFEQITHQQGLAAEARVVVEGHDLALQQTVSQALERNLAADNMGVFFLQRLKGSRKVLDNHLVIILVFLMLMAILVAAVGALGLASTMSVNVMERAREIGMMRAVGASTPTLLQIVIVEGVLVGILSWLLGVALAVPVTTIIANAAGMIILHVPLDVVIPMWTPVLWIGIVVAVAVLASIYPAWSAARLTVREVLAYE
jgi:putative ABC transport system permease protein